MSPLEPLWPFDPPSPPTEDQIFSEWLTFGGGWTLDEFRDAYLSTLR